MHTIQTYPVQTRNGRSRRPLVRVATLLALALGAFAFAPQTFAPTASAQPATDIVDSLPENTCAWVHAHDFASWNKAYTSSQFRKLLDRPAFQAFSSAWNQHTDSDAFALEFGLTQSELTELAQKDFVVAWLPGGSTELTTLAIIDATGAEQKVAAFLAKSAERFLKNGYQEQQTTIGDGQFRQFVSAEKQTVIGHHNGRFLVTHNLDVARDYLLGANAGQLSNDAGHRYVKERLGNPDDQAGSRIHWYCSPWRVMQHSPSPPSNLRLMIAQGFDAVDAVGGTFAFDAENVMTYDTVAHLQQPLKGAAVSLRTQPVTTELPDWLVAGSRGVQVAGLDAQSVLAGYAKWFDATEGEGEEGIFDLVLEEIRDEPDAPGVDIKVELFDQVASPLYSVRPKSPAGSGSEVVLPVVIVVKAKEAAVVQSAIGRMLEGDPDVRRVTFGAIAPDIAAWQFGDLTNGGTQQVLGPDLSQVTVCVYRDHVLASSSADSIAALIAPPKAAKVANDSDATLSQLDALVKQVAAEHPERSLIGYRFAHGADWMAQGYDRIRSTEVIEQSESTTVTLGNVTITMLNQLISGPAQSAFSKLPTRAEAQKHLGVALDVVHTANQDGWLASGVIQPATSASGGVEASQ